MKSILQPAYQPIYDLRFNKIAHYEALARLRHDRTESGHGPLIRLAEQFRFISAIDVAMLELVLRDAPSHQDTIAVNVSPHTISRSVCEIIARLDSVPIIAPRIIIEITETTPVQDERIVTNFMHLARELGVKIALDDFGTGAFTAQHVKALRPDYLKLDGIVLNNAMSSGDFTELDDALRLARESGSEIIAEYVDTDEKVRLLADRGIRYAQGAAFGMPRRKVEPIKTEAIVVPFPVAAA